MHNTLSSNQLPPPDNKLSGKPVNPVVVINRMYVGDYLSANLGHEAINLRRADNGFYYLYLNSAGNLPDNSTQGGSMLLVRAYDTDCFEIVGLARDLEIADGAENDKPSRNDEIDETQKDIINKAQRTYINQSPTGVISYDGVSIIDIFGDAGQQSVYITYRAQQLFVPKSGTRLFLRYDKAKEDTPDTWVHLPFLEKSETVKADEMSVTLTLRQHNTPKTSLRSYITAQTTVDYQRIFEYLIDDTTLWQEHTNADGNGSDAKPDDDGPTLFDICLIQSSETCFTNTLCYFFNQPQYCSLWQKFFESYGLSLDDTLVAEREVSCNIPGITDNRGRIDILLHDGKYIAVIENKLRSDLNTSKTDVKDQNQLDRYHKFVEWVVKKKPEEDNQNKYYGLIPRYFILAPDYNIPERKNDIAREYKPITYGKLYRFLAEHKDEWADDVNLAAFHHAMYRHTLPTVNTYLETEMHATFQARIDKLKKINNQSIKH